MTLLHRRQSLLTAADETRPIGAVHATLLRMLGPADSWDNPLVGTRYDPRVSVQRRHEQLEHRRAVWDGRRARWEQWRLGRHGRAGGPTEPG